MKTGMYLCERGTGELTRWELLPNPYDNRELQRRADLEGRDFVVVAVEAFEHILHRKTDESGMGA